MSSLCAVALERRTASRSVGTPINGRPLALKPWKINKTRSPPLHSRQLFTNYVKFLHSCVNSCKCTAVPKSITQFP